LKLSEAFSWEAFELVFNNGTVVQKCAVRQALLACISLPAVDTQVDTLCVTSFGKSICTIGSSMS
jgi:hypothetical protein